jgi:dTDP-4-amino-4,6-dideoxygalactose transaminase
VFRLLSAVPALGIGETRFDPGFRRGGIDGASLCLAAALLPRLELEVRARAERAERLARGLGEETRFAPLLPPPGSSGAFPRLGVLAPSERMRDAALAELRPFGATRLYPSPLDRIEALRPHLEAEARFPGASEFSARLLTLPAHDRLREAEIREIQRILRRLS